MPDPEVQDAQYEADLKSQARRDAEAAKDFMAATMKPFSTVEDGSSTERPAGKA